MSCGPFSLLGGIVGRMQVTRFGHSCLLVEATGGRILIDPGTLSDASAFEQRGLDGVVVTHQHPDHIDRDRAGLLFLRNLGARRLCDPDTAEQIGGWEAFADGYVTEFGQLSIKGVGTTHAQILPEIPRVANTGLLLRADGITLFHPGDTYEYAPSGVDVLALPLAAPWTKIAETVDFVRRVAPRLVFPIHDGGVTPPMHEIYWNHVRNHGGVGEMRDLGPTETATFA